MILPCKITISAHYPNNPTMLQSEGVFKPYQSSKRRKMSKFSSTNQPTNRRNRGKDKRTLILEALKESGMTQEQYWEKVVATSLTEPSIMKMVADKLIPNTKPTAPNIDFDFPHEGTASEKAASIETAAADGILPIDLAAQMMTIIKDRLDIHTNTELAQKLEEMIEKLEQQQNA